MEPDARAFGESSATHHPAPGDHPQSGSRSRRSSLIKVHLGQPISFVEGQFAFQTIRAELEEIQGAKVGRKQNTPSAVSPTKNRRVERRMIDPPPVVRLRLFRTEHEAASNMQVEREIASYDDVQLNGLQCAAELFRVPDACYEYEETSARARDVGPDNVQHTSEDVELVHRVNGFAVTSRSRRTEELVGCTVVEANLVQLEGIAAVVFAFSDLCVKVEGTYILRYIVFDIYSRMRGPWRNGAVIQAEVYGQPFRIFTSHDYPGLQESTELTRNLARWGVQIPIREKDRREKAGTAPRSPPFTTSVLKRKRDESGWFHEQG